MTEIIMSSTKASSQSTGFKKTKAEYTIYVAGVVCLTFLCVFFIFPVAAIGLKSLHNSEGGFVGLANYISFLSTPTALELTRNSLQVSSIATATAVLLAFTYAAFLTQTKVPLVSLFRTIALAPMLAPSLYSALSVVRVFGNQGIAKSLMGEHSIYGPIGIVLCDVFYTFPSAFLIILTAFKSLDARLYDAATMLGAGKLRAFLTVTLPNAKYGLISATCIVFTMDITDFGIPKVIGGQFSVFATEVYRQVIGQQNFELGGVISVLLLVPSVLTFLITRSIGTNHQTSGATRLPAKPNESKVLAGLGLLFCGVISLLILGVFTIGIGASFVKFWPYDLSLGLSNFDFSNKTDIGWAAISNSIIMASGACFFGTALSLVTAYCIERRALHPMLISILQAIAIVPSAVPGLVIGLGYLMFFTSRSNPLSFLYGTTVVLIICSIVHFFTVSTLTFQTALKKVDANFESVSASLGVSTFSLLKRVILPMLAPTIVDVAAYFFVSTMCTVSAIILLYRPNTVTATIGIVGLDDNGSIATAAAMGSVVVLVCMIARVLEHLIRGWAERGNKTANSSMVPEVSVAVL
ncbi:putative 2-aminoethylphosphonate ABC transporter permease subunit [Pseudomonas sp. MWU16-30317]|uniref:putative 2-aminoethylphosphonate ABC transporter permease subunit n=1 Tax=Pseudomonas sp. MWU16-30317 TaxID=2878095 RepID=UPI001CFC36BC|nr:putative 2-aminoethylphosphonate ABC transporter permease subunit [Pseudomonas sp. MWU16-30317]